MWSFNFRNRLCNKVTFQKAIEKQIRRNKENGANINALLSTSDIFAKQFSFRQLSYSKYKYYRNDNQVDKQETSSEIIVSHNIETKKQLTPLEMMQSISESKLFEFIPEEKLDRLRKALYSRPRARNIINRFIISEDVAKDVVDKFLQHYSEDKDFVVELNSGLGFITYYLFQSRIPKIIIHESSYFESICLKQLLQVYPDKIEPKDWLSFYTYGISSLIQKATETNKTAKVIKLVNDNRFFMGFIQHFVLNMSKIEDICHFEFFFILRHSIYLKFQNDSVPDFFSLLYKFLFNMTFLNEYPNTAFAPNISSEASNFYFVKVVGNEENIKTLGPDDLITLMVFAQLLMRKRNAFIIPTLEKWAPGCGPYLISKGVSMSNTVKEFSLSEHVTLFQLFKCYSGYEKFKVITQNFFSDNKL